MEMNFKFFMEMAAISREPLYIDKNDINYLKQFPYRMWTQALSKRYNDFIFDSLDNNGNLKEGLKRKQVVNMVAQNRTVPLKVNTNMPYVFTKLKKAGFDLSGINPITRTSLYYQPLRIEKSQFLIMDLKKTISPELMAMYKEGKIQAKDLDPKPDVVYWYPNYLVNARNDAELGKEDSPELNLKFQAMKSEIIAIINKVVNYQIVNQVVSAHPNLAYYKRPANLQKLKIDLIDYVWLNFKNPKFQDLERLYAIIVNKVRTFLQKGIISRKDHEGLLNQGLNVTDLYGKTNKLTNKPWTAKDIEKIMDEFKTNKFNHQERANFFRQHTDFNQP